MVAATLVAIAVLVVEGHNQWFFNDDWGQWAARSRRGPRIDDAASFFFDPHNGHWMTLNRVAFEVVYRMVGLRSYLPYLVPVIVVHITAAWLIRALCLRAGVDVWIASDAACIFLWFGAGAEVFVWADAFGFAAPIVLMGAQLVLTDHDGPVDRRDVLGAALAVLGMMAGAAAMTMLGVVALTLVLRARWRALVVAVAPAAVVWSGWWLWKGHQDSQDFVDRDHLSGVPNYVRSGVDYSIEAVTRLGLAAVVLVGLVVLAAHLGPRLRARGVAPLVSMAVGAVAWFLVLALTRINASTELAGASRYQYVGGFLLLPMIALGADRIARYDRRLLVVVLGLFAWSAVQNLFAIDSFARPWGQRKQVIERAVATVVALPGAEDLPPGTRIVDPQGRLEEPWIAPVDVLLALRDHGDLPDWGPPSEADRLEWGSAVFVHLVPAPPVADASCRTDVTTVSVDEPRVVVLRAAEEGEVELRLHSHDGITDAPPRRFPVPAGADVGLSLGLGDVDAELVTPPGTVVCDAGAER
jgi:hypothetical protein